MREVVSARCVVVILVIALFCGAVLRKTEKSESQPNAIVSIAEDGTATLITPELVEDMLKRIAEQEAEIVKLKESQPASSQVVPNVHLEECEKEVANLKDVIASKDETLQAWNKWLVDLRKHCAERGVRIPYSASEQEAAKARGETLPAILPQRSAQSWAEPRGLFKGRWRKSYNST